MLRRIFGGVALAAVITTGAHAQFITSFTLDAVKGGNEYNGTQAVGSIPLGSWDGFTANAFGATGFQVFCVDENHDAFPPATYNTWVSALGGADLSHTRTGGANVFQAQHNSTGGVIAGGVTVTANQAYAEAAFLANLMTTVSTPTQNDQGHFTGTVAIQYAIWEMMGNTFDAATEEGYSSIYANIQADEALARAAVTCAGCTFLADNTNKWVIFSDVSGSSQEFIANLNFPRDVPTPEPGTMAMLATGLVGLAGAGSRRRK